MNKNLLKVIYELRGPYDLKFLRKERLPEAHKFLLESERKKCYHLEN
ncbi:hypothetical protein KAX00_01715 [bacterium]|nr:hypothetical protein [bacterium]